MLKCSGSAVTLPLSIMAGNFSGVKIIGAISEKPFFIYLLKLRIMTQFEFMIHIYDKKDNFHFYSKNAVLEKKFSI